MFYLCIGMTTLWLRARGASIGYYGNTMVLSNRT
jgi:hypothetical protein